jgi:MarR family protein
LGADTAQQSACDSPSIAVCGELERRSALVVQHSAADRGTRWPLPPQKHEEPPVAAYPDVLDYLASIGLDETAHRFGRLLIAVHCGHGTPPRTIRGLAGFLGVPASSVVRGVDRLVADAFAQRTPDPHDGRSVFINLTQKGAELAQRMVA